MIDIFDIFNDYVTDNEEVNKYVYSKPLSAMAAVRGA